MIAIGTCCRIEQTVTPEYTAATIGSGMLEVFGTPYLCAMAEGAAQAALRPYLEQGQGSVGTHLDLSHTAPTPLGMKVYVEAEITPATDTSTRLEHPGSASDDPAPIGSGSHTRAIINNERFLAKCNAKLEQ